MFYSCRAPETPDCSNNLQLQNDQNPSDQRLWKEGCVEALTKVISDHVIYILGAGAAVLFMGKIRCQLELSSLSFVYRRNIWDVVLPVALLCCQED